MSEYVNPADCKPGEWYEGTVNAERVMMTRSRPDSLYRPWETLHRRLRDDEVSHLVRLVPARNVTRADMPDVMGLGVTFKNVDGKTIWINSASPDVMMDAVVEQWNANGGVPDTTSEYGLQAEVETLRKYLDQALERAKIAERDRDKAVGQRDESLNRAWEAEAERDEALAKVADLESRPTVTVRDADRDTPDVTVSKEGDR